MRAVLLILVAMFATPTFSQEGRYVVYEEDPLIFKSEGEISDFHTLVEEDHIWIDAGDCVVSNTFSEGASNEWFRTPGFDGEFGKIELVSPAGTSRWVTLGEMDEFAKKICAGAANLVALSFYMLPCPLWKSMSS